MEKAVRIARETNQSSRILMTTHVNLGESVWLSRGPAAGMKVYQQGIDLVAGRGSDVSWARSELMWLNFDLGKWDLVLSEAESLIDQWGGHQSQFVPWAQSSMARVHSWRGNLSAAAELQVEFLDELRRIRDLQLLAPGLAIAARTEFVAGNIKEAIQFVDEVYRETESTTPGFRSWVSTEMVRLLIAADEMERAEAWASSAINPVRRGGSWHSPFKAMMSEARGSSTEALRLHEKAASAWEDYGFVLEQALALNAIGRIKVGFGDDLSAQVAIERASRIFENLGVPSWVVDLGGTADRSAAL